MRLIICDDQLMFAESLRRLLGLRNHEVLGIALSSDEALNLATQLESELDVVLSELHFERDDSTPPIAALRAACPGTPIVAFTAEHDVRVLREAVLAGADGIVLKDEGIDELERIVLQVTSTLFKRLRNSARPEEAWSRRARSLVQGSSRRRLRNFLTPRERQVLEQLAGGLDTAAMAAELGVGEATVRTHLQNLFTKFGVHSRLGLVACAVRNGIVRVDGQLHSSRVS